MFFEDGGQLVLGQKPQPETDFSIRQGRSQRSLYFIRMGDVVLGEQSFVEQEIAEQQLALWLHLLLSFLRYRY